jgi:hypothetical protein
MRVLLRNDENLPYFRCEIASFSQHFKNTFKSYLKKLDAFSVLSNQGLVAYDSAWAPPQSPADQPVLELFNSLTRRQIIAFLTITGTHIDIIALPTSFLDNKCVPVLLRYRYRYLF